MARNPDPESRLPYLIWLPIEGGLVLKARDTWPRANRVFCAHGHLYLAPNSSLPRRAGARQSGGKPRRQHKPLTPGPESHAGARSDL